MAARTSSSSASSSETEETTTRIRDVSETSIDVSHGTSRHREQSPTNTIDGSTIAETTTLRSGSPTASHASTAVTGTPYDAVSIATVATGNTITTNNTAAAQRQAMSNDSIPIIRPPVLQQQQSGTGIGVFGPQRPPGYPTQPPIAASGNIVRPSGGVVTQQQSNYQSFSTTTSTNSQPPFVPPQGPPIQVDVALAHQQRAPAPEISPYGGSTTSNSSGSFLSPGNQSLQQQQQQQPHFDINKTTFNQADINKGGSNTRDEFQQWGAGGPAGQFQQQQQQQFANQISQQQVYNELLGPDAFKDVILNIDYGAIEAFNSAYQSGGDFSGGQLPPGIDVRPAYTTVDSLNYQQHMFNTARTVNATDGFANFESGSGVAGGGGQFDVVKAMFNQADRNRDGAISQEEFRQWGAGGVQQNVGQSFSSSERSYQTTGPSYASSGASFHNQGPVIDAANPAVANILNQSGLSRVMQGTR